MMYTPRRPVKRQLFFTPASTAKRARTGTFRAGAQTARFRAFNRRTQSGPRAGGTLTQQVKALQRFCKNLAPEVKYIDAGLNVTNIPATGTVFPITTIATGDIEGTRTGNAVNVTAINLSGYFLRNSTDFAADSFYRIALVQDKEQVADTSPTAAQIFNNTGLPTEALPLLDSLTRFNVLWLSPVFDAWMMRLDSDNLAASTPTQKSFWSHSWKGNIKVQYNGNSSTDIQKNGLYVVILSSTAVTTGDHTGTARVAYTDV